MNKSRCLFASLSVIVFVVSAAAQGKPVPVCSEKTFAALKQEPALEYECSDSLNDYDPRILALPRRRAAIARVIESLRSYTNPVWWEASVDELNACDLHGGPGELTDDEKERWRSGDYAFSLIGNRQTRLVLISDPCYQTGFGGSNGFLLHGGSSGVSVTQVLDGYYSRVDNSVGLKFGQLNGQRIVEVTTSNSMPPSLVSYFFTIDATGRALPKNIFRTSGHPTNEVYSAMLMGEPKEFNLPSDAGELNIIRKGKLAPSFSAYEESARGGFDANGRRLRRIVYRWNGRIYSRIN